MRNGINDSKPESIHNEAEPSKEESLIPSLNKQNSIFSLTLDEIQCKSGRTFGSMNMEEFIANIWSVEENQVSQEISINTNNTNSLSRQGSFSIPIPICKKTVDEIWFEIHKEESHSHSLKQLESEGALNNSGPQRQQTALGEMTLEDFLVKAGVVQEPLVVTKAGSSPSHEEYYYETTTMPDERHVSKKRDVNDFPWNGSGSGFPGYEMHGRGGGGGSSSNNICINSVPNEKSQSLTQASGGKSKRRIIDGPPEVVVERRQRRMIKNRESAARSRARKQVK